MTRQTGLQEDGKPLYGRWNWLLREKLTMW